jgi:hypothetical protein
VAHRFLPGVACQSNRFSIILEDNDSLDEFLDCFPTVRREHAVAVLDHSKPDIIEAVATTAESSI